MGFASALKLFTVAPDVARAESAAARAARIAGTGVAAGGAALAIGAGTGWGVKLFGESAGQGLASIFTDTAKGLEEGTKSLLFPIVVAAVVVGAVVFLKPRMEAPRRA